MVFFSVSLFMEFINRKENYKTKKKNLYIQMMQQYTVSMEIWGLI